MNPLLELHRQTAAEFQPYGDVEIVSTFGNVPAEYSAIHRSAAVMDLPFRGIIELTGPDRLSFLNNLVSNQTFDKQTKTGLSPGQGVYAFLLNAKTGRIITDMNLLELGDRTLLEMDRRMIEAVREALEKYHFAERVTIATRADELHEIALFGPQAKIPADVPAIRDDLTGTPGYRLIIPAADAEKIWTELSTAARPIGWAAFNAVRIEAGMPLFGIDFDETTLPHETGPLLKRAVSFTKGCYPGQEIVARMHARGAVARQIVGIRMNEDALPVAGAKIHDKQQNEIGGVTSSTMSPVFSNAALAIGMVKRPHVNPGTDLQIPAEGQMRNAKVVELPFLRPSL